MLTENLPDGSGAEAVLVRALERASAAGEWDSVKLIADELRARRLHAANVVVLGARRRAR